MTAVVPHQSHDQCCHSVVKKNPRIYLEKKTENNKKKPDIQNVTKSQNQTGNERYRYFLHIKLR